MRIYENADLEEIVAVNLKLFAQMIKYEGLVNCFYIRIEKKIVEAKAILREIKKEEALEEREKVTKDSDSDSDDSTKVDAA